VTVKELMKNSIDPIADNVFDALSVVVDPVECNARIEALRNVALEVLDIAKRKDSRELWDTGENLETACENCNRSYSYP
jgi:hypothetical protein